MLTPEFELKQTDDNIVLVIKAPLANVSDTELDVDGNTVIFYSSPYYLRIHLPGKVSENINDSNIYNCDSQEFYFTLLKENKKEYFPDLDMIGKLLLPKKKHTVVKPIIEDCSSEVIPSSDPESDEELGYIKQEIKSTLSTTYKYGFANKCVGIGKILSLEFSQIFDYHEFDKTRNEEISLLREANEYTNFSEDHYLADFMDDSEIKTILNWTTPWAKQLKERDTVKFTKEETETLKQIGNRDYLLDKREKQIALFSLIDIIYAYAYNYRTTFGDYNVESAWNINKLSSTFSWLQSYEALKEVKTACLKRSLIFPLFRHWELSLEIAKDTVNILKSGRRQVVKCLLSIYKMFNEKEPRYLLNELYIIDYCIWVQKISDEELIKLGKSFEKTEVSKSDLGLELEELEMAALIVQKEEEELEIASALNDLTLSSEKERFDEGSSGNESEDESSSNESEDESSTSESSTSTLDSDDLSEPE